MSDLNKMKKEYYRLLDVQKELANTSHGAKIAEEMQGHIDDLLCEIQVKELEEE